MDAQIDELDLYGIVLVSVTNCGADLPTEILEVQRGATKEEIKKKYHKVRTTGICKYTRI